MANGYLVSDWNGTLTRTTEEASNKHIGYSLLGRSKRTLNLSRLLKLKKAKEVTEASLVAYKKGHLHLSAVYDAFNIALEGVPVKLIHRYVDEFAKATATNVDNRTLETVNSLRSMGVYTGILSVAYDRVIIQTLNEAGFPNAFGLVVANRLEAENNRARGLTLDIYGRKARAMEEKFFRTRGFRPEATVYLGDTDDDAPVADLLPKGNFVVPLLATPEFKQWMTSKHGAFVPETAEDLKKYLFDRMTLQA